MCIGAKWLLENYPAEVECDVMLGEGGGFNFLAGTMHIGIALGEKGTINYKLIARGPGGHASLPTLDNPIFTISKVVQQLTNGQLRFRHSPLVEEFFAGMFIQFYNCHTNRLLYSYWVPATIPEEPYFSTGNKSYLIKRSTCFPTKG